MARLVCAPMASSPPDGALRVERTRTVTRRWPNGSGGGWEMVETGTHRSTNAARLPERPTGPTVPAQWRLGPAFVPKGRYLDPAFLDLELERLFPRTWLNA